MKNIGRKLDATELLGCFVALATPYVTDERLKPRINYFAIEPLMNPILKSNVHGVVVAGCTGSAYGLSGDERIKLTKHINQNYNGRLRVIAGDGGNCTWTTIGTNTQRREQTHRTAIWYIPL